MLDIECFSYLNRALEDDMAPIVVMATNRLGACDFCFYVIRIKEHLFVGICWLNTLSLFSFVLRFGIIFFRTF